MPKGSDNPFPSVLFVEQGSTPSSPAASRHRLFVDSAGDWYSVDSGGTVTAVGSGGGSGTVVNAICQGRLTTESGVAVSTSDRTAQATIYFTPYLGNQIALYNGSAWVYVAFAELSLALSGLTSGKAYDVFVDYNSGTPQLVLSAAWTDATTRADAVALQNGVYVKSGTPAYRLVGTIYTTGTTTTEDSMAKRFVWNLNHRRRRTLKNTTETANTWNYTTTSYRQANANTANQFEYVVGLAEDAIEAHVRGFFDTVAAGGNACVGIGVDSTTVNSALVYGDTGIGGSSIVVAPVAIYSGVPGLGYHVITWLELGAAGARWYGDANNPTNFQAGLVGSILN